jgi:DNA-binding transcriptional ArsR family regulator
MQGRASRPGRARLVLDPQGFARSERLVTYEIGNALFGLPLEMQKHFGLRAEAFQIFFLIALVTAQRFVRAPGDDEELRTVAPLPARLAESISRRRISDILGIPAETVRRHVAALLASGLIVERQRGRLSTPGGTLARLAAAGIPPRLAGQLVTLSNTLIRLGAARIEP